jgi:hypothetical protein
MARHVQTKQTITFETRATVELNIVNDKKLIDARYVLSTDEARVLGRSLLASASARKRKEKKP